MPRLPSVPILSSSGSDWDGLALEHHRLEPVDALVGVIHGYQICMHLSDPVSMTWKINSRWSERLIRRNELCLATHGELRSVSWRTSFEMLLVSLTPKLFSDYAAEYGRGTAIELVKHRGIRDQALETIVALLRADVLADYPAGGLYGQQLGRALVASLCGRFATTTVKQRTTTRSRLSGYVLKRVLDLIESQLEQTLTLEQLAAEAQVSRFYFSRLFLNSVGESPSRYVVSRRVERARNLLLRTNISLPTIASMSGFSSQSHLTTVFRERTGCTPSLYRRLAR